MSKITTVSYDNSIGKYPFYQCKSKLKNPMIITSDIYSDMGIEQTEAASTQINVINKNRNNDANHKIFLNTKIATIKYRYQIK